MLETGLLASVSLATGILFKLMMWPGATMLLLIGVVLLFLVFIPYMAYEGIEVWSNNERNGKNQSTHRGFFLSINRLVSHF